MWYVAFGLLCGLLAYIATSARLRHDEVMRRLASLEESLNTLLEQISNVGADVASTLPLFERQKRTFDALPSPRVDQMKELASGDSLGLNVFDYAGLRRIEFVFERLEFRSPEERDAVAHGRARTAGASEYHAARIFFNQYSNTAKLTGASSSMNPFFSDGGNGYVKLA